MTYYYCPFQSVETTLTFTSSNIYHLKQQTHENRLKRACVCVCVLLLLLFQKPTDLLQHFFFCDLHRIPTNLPFLLYDGQLSSSQNKPRPQNITGAINTRHVQK